MVGRHGFFLFFMSLNRSLAMQISYWVLLSTSINALPDASSKPSGDAAYSIIQRYSEDSSRDVSATDLINPLDPIAPFESPTYDTSDVDLVASIPPESDRSEILPSPPNSVPDSVVFPPEGSIPTFETAFVSDKDPEPAKPSCTSPYMAACCIKSSMFTSCVWWGLDRIFCEASDNYACCESIQDYIGSNCEHVGEEGKDWDWLEDILRTPIILQPPINPLEYLPRIPLIPERV